MFFIHVLNFTKSIFDIIDDWNKVLSLLVSIGAVLVSLSSFYFLNKSIAMEDPTKYTFKDFSEKDRYVILKPALAAITTIFIGFVLSFYISFCLTFNNNYQDVISVYIIGVVLFFMIGICFVKYYKTFYEKMSKFYFWAPKKIFKIIRRDNISKTVENITLIIEGIIVLFILDLIQKGIFRFNTVLFMVLYSLIISFFLTYIFFRVVGNNETIIFARASGILFISMAITLIPGFIYYIKINHTQIIDKYPVLLKLDDFIDSAIPVSIDKYFSIFCVLALVSLFYCFSFLNEKFISNYSNIQNLAYFYAERECDEAERECDKKVIYIYGKLDDYFIYDTKDYIKCSDLEQEENIKKINKFKEEILKNEFVSKNDEYIKDFNDLVDDMFYYVKYLNSSENEMRDLVNLLSNINIDSEQNLNIYIYIISKIFLKRWTKKLDCNLLKLIKSKMLKYIITVKI